MRISPSAQTTLASPEAPPAAKYGMRVCVCSSVQGRRVFNLELFIANSVTIHENVLIIHMNCILCVFVYTCVRHMLMCMCIYLQFPATPHDWQSLCRPVPCADILLRARSEHRHVSTKPYTCIPSSSMSTHVWRRAGQYVGVQCCLAQGHE